MQKRVSKRGIGTNGMPRLLTNGLSLVASEGVAAVVVEVGAGVSASGAGAAATGAAVSVKPPPLKAAKSLFRSPSLSIPRSFRSESLSSDRIESVTP